LLPFLPERGSGNVAQLPLLGAAIIMFTFPVKF
jgi:hypothetical protein